MSVPIVSEPRPLLTFVDAPIEAIFCVGVLAGVLLVIVFVGLTEVVRLERRTAAAKHRPSGGRMRVPAPRLAIPREPRHSTAQPAATQAMAAVHPSYLGPDVERAQQLPAVRREPVTTGGTR